jgi:hypothetical protein
MIRLIEFDTVRVIALHGTAADHLVARASDRTPQLGDIATIVHLTSDPDDHYTRYIVEQLMENGATAWLAEFERDELEFVSRPG